MKGDKANGDTHNGKGCGHPDHEWLTQRVKHKHHRENHRRKAIRSGERQTFIGVFRGFVFTVPNQLIASW
ncbi:Uncharacterised protein [Vibrio cholerae]|uniref:Uncharacterized protein n=1 Tax=Vibrio cholerae TaxID=666 RepID=A0A655R7P0_VIBCL|nr:Uncharacterised protein [Vibrio cholerae]CSB12136.1 Uncharacterised protein [Vibrio cholerae]CSB84004.1 Uncharacterised protein [Vibrio cholerae]CSI34368.1 Uncharacterised protein [Vibrio cholerae]